MMRQRRYRCVGRQWQASCRIRCGICDDSVFCRISARDSASHAGPTGRFLLIALGDISIPYLDGRMFPNPHLDAPSTALGAAGPGLAMRTAPIHGPVLAPQGGLRRLGSWGPIHLDDIGQPIWVGESAKRDLRERGMAGKGRKLNEE